MASRREKFFKGQVLKALYQDKEESSDEETRKKSFENLEKLKQAVKRKVLEQPELDKRTGDSDWPVPLPKLKKVYTVSVNPEDLSQTVNKIQGRDTPTSPGTSSNQQTQDSNSSTKTVAKLSKNKRRKLKKKRRQKEKEQDDLI